MAKIDLKDAYFAVPISEPDRKYLRFRWKSQTYQFNCLPFGLSRAPWVFTKITKAVAAVLREMGMRLIIMYIDYIMLIMAQSETMLRDHVKGIIYLLENLGFVMNCTADAESRIMRDRSDWMLCPNIFCAINHELGPLELDLFASRLTTQLSLLCELETRPGSNDNRCFHHVLERTESLCQPTMESGGKGPLPSSSTGSRSDPGGTSVENTAVVPGDTGNIQRLSMANTPEMGSNPTNSPTGNARCSPPASHVEYLRECYKEQQLSEKATELMLASWALKVHHFTDRA